MNYEGLLRLSCGEAEIQQRLMGGAVFCLLMSPDLSDKAVFNLAKAYVLLDVDDGGEQRLAIAYGMYRNWLPEEAGSSAFEEVIADGQKEASNTACGAFLERILEVPRLCWLIRDGVPAKELGHMRQAYRVIDFMYEGKGRSAIACAIYRASDYEGVEVEGRITSQHWEFK